MLLPTGTWVRVTSRQNKLTLGEQLLSRSVAALKNIRELNDTLREELPQLEVSSRSWTNHAQVLEILDQIREQISVRTPELKSMRSPERELQDVIDRLASRGELQALAMDRYLRGSRPFASQSGAIRGRGQCVSNADRI